jgi:tetratricopeptide (TPR) repeat protein
MPPDAPRSPVAEIAAGLAAMRAGDSDRALAAFAAAETQAAADDDPAALSSALRHQSLIWRQRSDWDRAGALAQRAAEVAEAAGLREPLAEAYNAAAIVHQARGAYDAAEPLLNAVLTLTYDQRVLGAALANLGSLAAMRGDLEGARRRFLEAAQRFRACGYSFGEATVLNNVGRAGLDKGNALVSAPLLRDALGAARRAGDAELTAIVQRNLAEALGLRGENVEADSLAREALATFTAGRNEPGRAECLRVLGELAERAGDTQAARTHFHEALLAARTGAAPVEVELITARLAALDAR